MRMCRRIQTTELRSSSGSIISRVKPRATLIMVRIQFSLTYTGVNASCCSKLQTMTRSEHSVRALTHMLTIPTSLSCPTLYSVNMPKITRVLTIMIPSRDQNSVIFKEMLRILRKICWGRPSYLTRRCRWIGCTNMNKLAAVKMVLSRGSWLISIRKYHSRKIGPCQHLMKIKWIKPIKSKNKMLKTQQIFCKCCHH